MRYLASAAAHSGCSRKSLWPLKWKSPINGTLTPARSRRSRIGATAAAASAVFTVMRTSSEPARWSAATWATVASTSAVSVLVIDWTTIGAVLPTRTPPTSTATDSRRGKGDAKYPAMLGLLPGKSGIEVAERAGDVNGAGVARVAEPSLPGATG